MLEGEKSRVARVNSTATARVIHLRRRYGEGSGYRLLGGIGLRRRRVDAVWPWTGRQSARTFAGASSSCVASRTT